MGLNEHSTDKGLVTRASLSGASPCPSAVVPDPFGRPSVAPRASPLQRDWPKPAAPLAYRRADSSPWRSECLPTETTRPSLSALVWIVDDTHTPSVNGNVQQPSVSRVSTGSRVNAPPTARLASVATFSVTIAAEWSGARRLGGARVAEGTSTSPTEARLSPPVLPPSAFPNCLPVVIAVVLRPLRALSFA